MINHDKPSFSTGDSDFATIHRISLLHVGWPLWPPQLLHLTGKVAGGFNAKHLVLGPQRTPDMYRNGRCLTLFDLV